MSWNIRFYSMMVTLMKKSSSLLSYFINFFPTKFLFHHYIYLQLPKHYAELDIVFFNIVFLQEVWFEAIVLNTSQEGQLNNVSLLQYLSSSQLLIMKQLLSTFLFNQLTYNLYFEWHFLFFLGKFSSQRLLLNALWHFYVIIT